MQITKENYQDLVWEENNVSYDDYNDFYKTLSFNERIDFLKFLLEKYPDYDEEWIHYYFDIAEEWIKDGQWEAINEFSDFVREKSPSVYKKKFNYLDKETVVYALFKGDLELAKKRFSETVAQPDKAIDDSLRMVFNLISANRSYNAFTKEIAEKIWSPLAQSERLIGGAEFDYSLFLYCQYLEEAFEKIHSETPVDWELFTKNVESIQFKYVEELGQLPEFKVEIDLPKFHRNQRYRNEKINSFLTPMLYDLYVNKSVSVYWAFRTWLNLRKYLWEHDDSPKRANFFSFTPKMIDQMGGRLNGFFGGNRHAMIITTLTIPYIFDWLLKAAYIEKSVFDRLMNYYQFTRRIVLNIASNTLWMFSGIYDWQKPDFISEEHFEAEKSLALNSINQTREEAKEAIQQFKDSLPELPKEAIPPDPEPSPFEKLLARRRRRRSPKLDKPETRVSRPKVKRKKRPKPNRRKKKKKRKK